MSSLDERLSMDLSDIVAKSGGRGGRGGRRGGAGPKRGAGRVFK